MDALIILATSETTILYQIHKIQKTPQRNNFKSQTNVEMEKRKDKIKLPPLPSPKPFIPLLKPVKVPAEKDARGETISVVVRIRPFSTLEKIVKSNGKDLITLDPTPPNHVRGPSGKRHRNLCFAFDRVLDEDVDQQMVYEATSKNLLSGLLEGFNATVFAYGTFLPPEAYMNRGNRMRKDIYSNGNFDRSRNHFANFARLVQTD
jgi:hypothetical protein